MYKIPAEKIPAKKGGRMRLEELFSVVAEGNHTRDPIFEDDSGDRIVGMPVSENLRSETV